MDEKDKTIKKLVDLHFDNIPYSTEADAAKKKIISVLDADPENKDTENLISKYGTLSQMGKAAGYTEEEIEQWKAHENVVDQKAVKSGLRRQRWLAYFFALICAGALGLISWMMYYIASLDLYALIAGGLLLVLGGIGSFILIGFKRFEKKRKDEKYNTSTFSWLKERSDKYTKRLLNSIAILVATIAIFIGAELTFNFSANTKPNEVIRNIFTNIYWVMIPVFLVVKNLLMVKVYQNRINLPVAHKFKWHEILLSLISIAYWALAFLIALLSRKYISYYLTPFIIAGVTFIVLLIVYNYTLRAKITQQNFVFNKTRIAVVLIAAILVSGFTLMNRETFYTQPYINSLPVVEHNANIIEYDDETGIYTITAVEDDFKILHLTDIHLGGSIFSYSKDLKALTACYQLIEYTHPDFVIVTGDLCYPVGAMSMSFNNSAPVNQFSAFMRNLGIPWAFTYGNHDTESIASLNKKALNEVFMSLSYKSSRTLLYPYVQPNITGRNNQLIKLNRRDGTLNMGLFLIDSNAYVGTVFNSVYDYIHDDQVEWYAEKVAELNDEAGHLVKSLAFFHIPLQEYRTAFELYEAGSDEVTYFFGENKEDRTGEVCCSDHPSQFFATALELGSTTGMFCGHDHYNNISLEYEGIRLTYGMSIDYLAMPGIEKRFKQRGAELITVHDDSTWDLEQIPLELIAPEIANAKPKQRKK